MLLLFVCNLIKISSSDVTNVGANLWKWGNFLVINFLSLIKVSARESFRKDHHHWPQARTLKISLTKTNSPDETFCQSISHKNLKKFWKKKKKEITVEKYIFRKWKIILGLLFFSLHFRHEKQFFFSLTHEKNWHMKFFIIFSEMKKHFFDLISRR